MLDDFGAVLCDEADLTHISRTDVALARGGEGIFDEIDGVIDREVDAEGWRLGGALLVLPLELVIEEGLDERLARAGHLKRTRLKGGIWEKWGATYGRNGCGVRSHRWHRCSSRLPCRRVSLPTTSRMATPSVRSWRSSLPPAAHAKGV